MSVNKVILVGNVGKDPDIRYLDNNVCVANLTLATTEKGYTTASGIQIPDKTEWHNIVLWRGLAEIAEKYVRKGMQIYIEGKIRTRSWDDQNNVRRYTTEIYGDNMMLLGKKSDPVSGNPSDVASRAANTRPAAGNTSASNSSEEILGGNNQADDLPF